MPARPGWYRAHAAPPGHGVEDPAGLSYSSRQGNQSVDQRIDNQIRSIYRQARLEGNQVEVTVEIGRGPNSTLSAKHVEVEMVRPDGSTTPVLRTGYRMNAEGEVIEPYVDLAPNSRPSGEATPDSQ